MSFPDVFARLIAILEKHEARFVVIGVFGANYYAGSASGLFTTLDRDLFLPKDPSNLLATWRSCEESGLELFAGREPLDYPRDLDLARRVVGVSASTRASDGRVLDVDLSLTMTGFDFDTVWVSKREFEVAGTRVPVARLSHIVSSKAATGRPKDQSFLSSHAEILRRLVAEDESEVD
ncbi:MAG: hypothetical protein RL885_09365 [Planctomycetota bacterium]